MKSHYKEQQSNNKQWIHYSWIIPTLLIMVHLHR